MIFDPVVIRWSLQLQWIVVFKRRFYHFFDRVHVFRPTCGEKKYYIKSKRHNISFTANFPKATRPVTVVSPPPHDERYNVILYRCTFAVFLISVLFFFFSFYLTFFFFFYIYELITWRRTRTMAFLAYMSRLSAIRNRELFPYHGAPVFNVLYNLIYRQTVLR